MLTSAGMCPSSSSSASAAGCVGVSGLSLLQNHGSRLRANKGNTCVLHIWSVNEENDIDPSPCF